MEYTQNDIDAIIKKLGEQGYEGLNKEEKQILFQRQLRDAKGTRYDTPLELFLSFIVLLTLVIHGLQRIVLATELPVYLKLGSVGFSKWLNIGIGLFSVLFFGLLLVLAVKDYLQGKIYFTGTGSTLKYWGKLSFFLIIILLISIKIISCWSAFMSKLF